MKYRFVHQGYAAGAEELDGKTLFLDVGNALGKGIFDHHQSDGAEGPAGASFRSASLLLTTYPQFIPPNVETIVLHRNSDFDCWLSVWLVLHYLARHAWPESYEILTEYAVRNDQGLADFRTPNAIAPIACLVPEAVGKETGPWRAERMPLRGIATADGKGDAHEFALLERGLAFVEYLFERLASQKKRLSQEGCGNEWTADMPGLFDFPQDWPVEYGMAVQDQSLYLAERDNPDCCEICRVSLPNTLTGQKEMTDALLWHVIPSCRLHRFWARSDQTAASGGFVLTAIPQFVRESEGLPVTRVILSTNPHSPFNLRNLGAALERAELLKEKEICAGRDTTGSSWRTREAQMHMERKERRFPDEWCVNHDPWYDGRAHAHTIVDAPGRGSLLSIREIIGILKGYLKPELASCRSRIAFPLSWAMGKHHIGFSAVARKLTAVNGFESFEIQKAYEGISYFHEPVSELFAGSGKSLSFHAWHIAPHLIPRALWEAGGADGSALREDKTTADLLLLRNGVGYLVLGTEFDNPVPGPGGMGMNRMLGLQKAVAEQATLINEWLTPWLGRLEVSKAVVFTAVRTKGHMLGKEDLNSLSYKICNKLSYLREDESLHTDEDAQGLSRNGKLMRVVPVQRNVVFGFAQQGIALCLHEDGRDGDKLAYYEKHFFGAHFYAFLLALNQRFFLLSISRRLSRMMKGKNAEREALNLKRLYMEHLTQAAFGQISPIALISHLYATTNDVFQVKALSLEVESQLKAYDSFVKDERSRKVGLVTAFYLPAQIIQWIVAFKIITIANVTERNVGTWAVMAAFAVLSGLLYLYIRKQGRYH